MNSMLTRSRGTLIALAVAASLTLTACSGKESEAPAPAPAAPAVAAAPAAAPAEPAAPAFDKLILVESNVRGSYNMTDEEKAAGQSCVLEGKYLRNEQIVWRVKVIDPLTGEELDDTKVEKLEVKLADGQVFTAKYGVRPKDAPTDGFWTVSWKIPEDYPPGLLNYEIAATSTDGRGAQYVQFKLATAMMTIVPEVRAMLQ